MLTDETDHRLRLTLRQLEVFRATALAGSTRAAAERVSRSQSAASAALAEVEAALGQPLFDRVGRRLVLNEAGAALLPHATALLEQASQIEQSQHALPMTGLHVAASLTVGECLMPSLLAQWSRQHPGRAVRLDIANSHDVLDAVARCQAAVGFIEGPAAHPELSIRRWRHDALVIVCAPDHPLAARRVTRAQLQDSAWIVREAGSGTREACVHWLGTQLDDLRIGMELGSNEAVRRAVRDGAGPGCLSLLAVADSLRDGSLVQVRSPLGQLQRPLSIVLHRARTPGALTAGFLHWCRSRDTPQSPDGTGQADRP